MTEHSIRKPLMPKPIWIYFNMDKKLSSLSKDETVLIKYNGDEYQIEKSAYGTISLII